MGLLQILMVSSIVLSMGSSVHGEDDLLLPGWFWDTPVSDEISFAVGYSNAYIESDHAFGEAFEDAVLRLFTDIHCHIKGEKASASSPGGTMHMGSTIQLVSDTTGLAAFREQVVRLDSVRTPEMLIMLVSTRQIKINRKLTKQPGNPETENGVPCSAPLYMHQSSSWIEAERQARIEIATGISSVVKVIDRKQDGRVTKTIVTATDVMLTNVQTIHRRIDWKNGFVKVWLRRS